MIIEDYVSFETAKLLKEKGFSEECHYAYHYYTNQPFYHRKMNDFNGEKYRGLKYEWYSAPTLQMAMKWLREVHHIVNEIKIQIRESVETAIKSAARKVVWDLYVSKEKEIEKMIENAILEIRKP